MEGLGRVFNVLPVADNVYINMRDFDAVSFLGVLAGGDTYTVTEATSAAGAGAQVLAKVTQFYTSTGDGSGAWTKVTQAAASTAVTTAAACVLVIGNTQLSDGYKYVKVASTSTGTVTAIGHDLKTARTPENLPAVGV